MSDSTGEVATYLLAEARTGGRGGGRRTRSASGTWSGTWMPTTGTSPPEDLLSAGAPSGWGAVAAEHARVAAHGGRRAVPWCGSRAAA